MGRTGSHCGGNWDPLGGVLGIRWENWERLECGGNWEPVPSHWGVRGGYWSQWDCVGGMGSYWELQAGLGVTGTEGGLNWEVLGASGSAGGVVLGVTGSMAG